MKNCENFEERWNYIIKNLLQLAKGNLTKKLKIKQYNDQLESLELLINVLHDEWKQRFLYLTFKKPSESMLYIKHFQFIVDKELRIKNMDQSFIEYIKTPSLLYKNKLITDFLSKEDQKHFNHLITSNTGRSDFIRLHSRLNLFGEEFEYNINTLIYQKLYVLNLYSIQIDNNYKCSSDNEDANNKNILNITRRKRIQDLIEQAKHEIDRHPRSKILRLKNLCKNLGINSFQLKKGFKEQYQCTPYNYFKAIRMKHAYLLIETGTVSLKEISQSVGYVHYSTFCSQFYKFYNILPNELRKRKQETNTKKTAKKAKK